MYNLTHNYITEIFDYSICSDHLTWKVKKSHRIEIGQKAGSPNSEGYILIGIDGEIYRAHHLIWFYIFEEWPNDELDHRDENKGNNNIFNLREATNSQNSANRKKLKNNTSGFKGVSSYAIKKYRAHIVKDGKKYHLGCFDCPIEAAKKYDKAAKKLYGEFANLNFPNEKE